LKSGFGEQASKLIVAEESYEVTEPTIESHVVKLKSTGADVFFDIATPKFAAQAIKKSAEIGWTPVHFISNSSSSTGGVRKPAGLENAQGIVSGYYAKDPLDPQWAEDAGLKRFDAFLNQYLPET
jgi:branched-chain amino acid transport system substrate-binding protein